MTNVLRLSGPAKSDGAVISLSYDKFNTMFKLFYKRAFGTSMGVSSHSLRRGGTTAMVAAGVREELIMKHGRWVSSTWREYIDLTHAQQLVATQALLRILD